MRRKQNESLAGRPPCRSNAWSTSWSRATWNSLARNGPSRTRATPSLPAGAPMDKGAKIFVAGHRGMVGSAIVRRLENDGYTNLVLRTRQELDLTQQAAVRTFFQKE